MMFVSNVNNTNKIDNVIVDLGILAFFWARIDLRIMTFLWNTIKWWGVANVDDDDVIEEDDEDDDDELVVVDDNFIMMILLIVVIGSNDERPVVNMGLNDGENDNNRFCWDGEYLVAVVLLYESNDESHVTSPWMANLFDDSWFGWIFDVVDDDLALWSNEHVSSDSIGLCTLSI